MLLWISVIGFESILQHYYNKYKIKSIAFYSVSVVVALLAIILHIVYSTLIIYLESITVFFSVTVVILGLYIFFLK